ncbi:MAG: FAD-dependent monooxygenase [Pseudomonadota bacterium]|nr:FAD-dependent monooxygenase [Pseudomonadota bacterium]
MSGDNRVLIAGGGPIGYTTAFNLAKYGIPFTLFEAGEDIAEDPRAATIHPPTLEMFDKIGLTATFMERGFVTQNYHYRDRKQGLIADFDLGVLKDDTEFPYRVMLEQHKISRIIASALLDFSEHKILNRHTVLGVIQDGDEVVAQVETPQGKKEFRGCYMIGCDGGRSNVRKSIDVDFEGFQFEERFLVVSTPYNFGQHGYAITNYIADPEEWCALFCVKGPDDQGLWRVVFPVDSSFTEKEIFDDKAIEERLQGFHPRNTDYEIIHRNLYEVHQRVATKYREGRILIAGDAAHINNPLGGMGMNFGFHDAFNLTEKLNKIWFHDASEDLLDLYERQRRTVASEYLQTQTIENKKNLERKSKVDREKFFDELRNIVMDNVEQRKYLRRVAMIEGVERAASIS